MASSYRIGVDGGGTKTELIVIDECGEIVTRHTAPGCNPSVIGPQQARAVLLAALLALVNSEQAAVSHTLLCMAGSADFWRETASSLAGYGKVTTASDALPVLELATGGRPGLVLHAGTGSFVALRASGGAVHFAGGLGWRLGDPGSAQDIGRRGMARALAELQGWAPASALGAVLQEAFGTDLPGVITAALHREPEPNQRLGVFAARISLLASEGDMAAREVVLASTGELLACAEAAAQTFFGAASWPALAAAVSGPILTQPFVLSALQACSALPLKPLAGAPIEGVRRLLLQQT